MRQSPLPAGSTRPPAAALPEPELAFNEALDLVHKDRAEDARAVLEKILESQPRHVAALNLLGVIAGQSNRPQEAAAWFDRVLTLQPEHAAAHCNKAYALLMAGDFARGWQHYEWRFQLDESPDANLGVLAPPRWSGTEPLHGKTILLRSEQGLGDTLQFCRYVKLVAARGARVLLEVPKPLVCLLADLEGVAQIVVRGDPLPDFDYHCPLMSLPKAFGTDLGTIPCRERYLASDPGKAAEWCATLGERRRPRVGLVFSGSPGNKNDRHRSIPWIEFARHLPRGIQYVILQKEIRDRDALALRSRSDVLHFAHELHDFSDTAALCECMDLIVSVDTSVAHLAAGLGKPTWLLLMWSTTWRWLLDRDDSPWYAAVRLYRQSAPGDWNPALERLGSDLERRFAGCEAA